MARSGNEGRTLVFQSGWDWFRAPAHGDGKGWVERSVKNYLKDKLKLAKLVLAHGISRTGKTQEHSLLRLGLKVSRQPGQLVQEERKFFKCHFFQNKAVIDDIQGMSVVTISHAPRREYYIKYEASFQHSSAVGGSMNSVQAILYLAQSMNENTVRILITSLGALLPNSKFWCECSI